MGSLIGGILWTIPMEEGAHLSFEGFMTSLVGAILFLLVLNSIRRRRGQVLRQS